MKVHTCKQAMYYEEYYGEYVADGWPPRCETCGRFMKWPPPVLPSKEFCDLFFSKETLDEPHDQTLPAKSQPGF
jgi:hypothetical protein